MSDPGTASDREGRYERLLELPPSAKLVYKVLEIEETLTQSQLATETRLSGRTVRDALGRLRAADLVDEEVYLMDARQKLYRRKAIRQPD